MNEFIGPIVISLVASVIPGAFCWIPAALCLIGAASTIYRLRKGVWPNQISFRPFIVLWAVTLMVLMWIYVGLTITTKQP